MKKIDRALFIFIILQPFLDFYLLFSPAVTKILKFSPSTIIRVAFCFIMLILIILKVKLEKKEKTFILVYLFLLLVYMAFHIYNSLKFDSTILETMTFSYVTEFFYYLRLMLPFIIAYITYKSNIKEDTFKKSIVIVSLIFSLEIIITNIFKISLKSYGTGFISGNIFDWFLNNSYQFEDLASKGFFYMANQISAVLMLLLPINIYYAIRFSDKLSYISSVCLATSMIMLGTRVSTYGWLLVALCMLISWIFFIIFKKENFKFIVKNIVIYVASLLMLLVIMSFSPLTLRKDFKDYEKIENNIDGRDDVLLERKNLESDTDKNNFVKNYASYFSIPSEYILELYPYENDVQFWIDTMDLPYSERGGNRNLEKLITKRIYELNSNPLDKYFGMGYSRYRNAEIYIESDFTVHYYTIGIFGIILFLLPYILIATYAAIYMLYRKRLRFKIVVLCISIYVCIGISFYSGHVLDELIVTIILGFICGYLLHFVRHDKEKYVMKNNEKESKNNKKIKVSVIIPVYNSEKYISKCLDSLVNQEMDSLQIIAIDDGSKDGSGKILDDYSNKYPNIIVKHITNGGVSNARNVGLSLATGEYIGFVDSDDYVDSTMYGKLYEKAKNDDLDIVACNALMVYPNKEKTVSCGISATLDNYEYVKRNALISSYHVIWNKIYRKSILKNIKFKVGSNFCEDVEFLYRVFPIAKSIGAVDETLYYYIQHEGSLTYVYDKKLYQLIENLDGIAELYNSNKKYTNYLDEIEYSYVRYLYGTFIKRLAKTKNKEEFDKGVIYVINKVNEKFPNYKNNKYIKKFTLKNIYLKRFNSKLANIIFKLEKDKMN